MRSINGLTETPDAGRRNPGGAESTGRIPCRKCLLSELSDQALYLQIKKTAEAIPDRERAPEETFRGRLSKCRSCDALFQGMCRECGCYVELRAARLKSRCPAAKPEW